MKPCINMFRGTLGITLTAMLIVALGCGGDSPTAPTGTPPPPPPSAPTPAPSTTLTRYHVTGTVTDETGLPVAHATVAVYYHREGIMTSTTGSGYYEADFETDQLQYYGTPRIVGVVQAWRGDEYEYYVQSLPWGEGATVNIVRNLRLRRVRTIGAGQSITVSIAPDSSLAHDGEDWLGVNSLWEKFHIRVDAAGTLTLEAHPEAGGIVPTVAVFCIYTKDNCLYDWVTPPSDSARSLRVKANSLFEIRVAIPSQSAPQRYEFSTSLAQ